MMMQGAEMIKLTPAGMHPYSTMTNVTPCLFIRRFYFLYEKRNVHNNQSQKGVEMITTPPAKCILVSLAIINRMFNANGAPADRKVGVGTNGGSGHKPSFFTEITARAENTP
jgi:hypothetical protein